MQAGPQKLISSTKPKHNG